MNPELIHSPEQRPPRAGGAAAGTRPKGPTPERLMQLLLREDAAGRRKFRDGHALDVEARVEAGDCVTDLTLMEDDGTALVLGAGENHSRFREGDPAWLGDGARPGAGLPVNVIDYDPVAGLLRVERDVFARNEPFDLDGPCVLDRREISTIDKLARALQRSLSGRAPAGDLPTRLLAGDSLPPIAPGGLAGSRAQARADGLDPSQEIAYAEALAAGPLYLVQGPPGSGKTRLLGSLLRAFAARGERVLVTAFTHLAINNVLRACLAGGDAPCPVFKIGRPAQNPDLQALPITIRPRLRRDAAAEGPLIVGATVYGAIGLWDALPFDRVVIDEAAQVPLPMGMAALGSAPRTTLVGDHQQMGPIVRTDPPDALAGVSIFAHLHAIYGSTLLTRTYRMNAEINDFVSRHFYAGRLASDPSCAGRRLALQPGGRFRDLLDPERPAVVALVDHEGCRQRAPAEAALAAELVIELMAHHRVPASEIAVIAPYRAQVNAIRQALRARVAKRSVKSGGNLEAEPVIDTVERIQGQERDVVIASFTNSDPDYLIRDASFFYSPNRLNVLLSRARVKRIVIASPLAFRAIPRDLETLRHASLFRRLHDESDRMVVPGGDA